MQTRQLNETSSIPAPPLRGLRSLGVDILMHHVFPWLPLKDLVAVAGTNRALASMVEHTRDWGHLYAQAFPNDMAPLPEPLAAAPAPSFARFARRAAGQVFRWGILEHTFDGPRFRSLTYIPLLVDPDNPCEVVRHPRALSDVAIRELLKPSWAVDSERILRKLCTHDESRVVFHEEELFFPCGHLLCTGHDVWIPPEQLLIRQGPDNPRLRAVPVLWNAPQVQGGDMANNMRSSLGWIRRIGGATVSVDPALGIRIPAQSGATADEAILLASLRLQNGDKIVDINEFHNTRLLLSSEGRLYAIKWGFWPHSATLIGLTEPVHRELDSNLEVYTLLPRQNNLRFNKLVEYSYRFSVLAMRDGRFAVVSDLSDEWLMRYHHNPYALRRRRKLVSEVKGSILVGLTLNGEVWYIRNQDQSLYSSRAKSLSPGSSSRKLKDYHIVGSGLEALRVPGLSDIVDILSTCNNWLALDSHGRVFALGSHNDGAAGLGTGASYEYITWAELRKDHGRLPLVTRVEYGPRPLSPEGSCCQFSLLPRRVPLPGHAVSIAWSHLAYGALVAPWDAQVKG